MQLFGGSGDLSFVFGLVPFGLFTSSVGFLESTKVLERSAMAAGGVLLAPLGCIAPLGAFFSTMPSSVGSSVLFVAYLPLFGTALRYFQKEAYDAKTVYRVALPVLTGIAVMTLPPEALQALPVYIRPLLSNGLVVGVLLSVLLENTVNWQRSGAERSSSI
ncbi:MULTISPECIES: purine/pyrimidine permease [Paenibacillus]|uniref:purine/pyrimidine permease n=1 Tax=Paenibacillus TaxID=44249 RepID=UPI0022B8A373|nr:purine/pyrimidine permease [Paenibacillus caseinilyticus]MCZ8521923.1 purine/pyrimidine permease [Paenibacillus caseinilyticus]